MGKPSLLQTLLRQPSQSYANSYDPSTSRRIGSSSGSRSSDGGHDDERNGTGWAWSSFSGRTSGGGGSVRSSVGGRGREEDDRSLRSSKSLGSLRSQSTQRSYGNGASWTSEGGSVREGKARAKAGRSERTTRVYGETQPLPVRYEQEEEEVPQQTSRRYSTIVETAAVATPIISITSSSPTSPRSFPLPDEPSPSAHTSTVDWSPSLSSSSSTSGSSTPSTPVLSSPEMVYTSISASSTRLEQIQEESQRGQIRRQLYSGTYGLDPVPEDTEDEGEDRKVIRTLDRAVSLDGERMQMWKQERDRPRSTRNPSTIPLPFSPSVAPLLEADESNTRPGSPVELPPTVRPEAVSLPESPPLTTNKVFSMDEVFGDLPFPTDLLCTPTSSSVEFTVVATTAQIITVSPASPLASVLALVEPSTIPLPPSPLLIPTPTFPSPAVEPILPTPPKEYRSISAAHKRLSMSLLPYASSDESSIRSGTDVSSLATEVTMSDGTSPRKSLAKYKVANVPAHALSNGSTTPPRRPSPSKSSRPKSMSSFNPASQSPPQISYDIISSSKLTAANLTSSSGTRAVPDTPEWLRNIRALGEPIQPLIIQKSSLNRRHSSLSTKSTAIVRDPPTAALSSYASRASLRVPRNVMPTMLEDQEVLADDTRWSTPSHSPGGSVVGRGEATIPRRRTQSAAEAPTLIFPPLPPGVIDNTPVPSLDVPHASSTMRERKRPVSIFSVTSLGGQSTHSISGLSTMSVPVGAYRPVKTPNRFSLGSETIVQSSATMSALSISANATAALQNSSRLFSRFGKKADVLPPHLAHRFDPARDLTFGGLRPPPTKLRSDEVLVEVHAVGVDQWDYARVVEMGSKPEGFGWIPGRSFCGRALECGAEVSKIKRGDFVFGLNELKKSGALAELMTVHRDLLTLAPSCGVSVDDIAALPLAGISAVQVMETLCQELPRGSKILVLNAHTGVGNLCMQLAFTFRSTRDLWMVAQCSPSIPGGESYCRATGASDVMVDEPLAALNCLHESSFDVVIDTVGGRRLYDAARRVLHYDGRFITTVGDDLSLTTPSTQWKTGIRSLRRSFFKKDKKQISYWAVHLDERENTREALEKLREAVEGGGVRPVVKRVVPFSEAARAFEDSGDGVVVRVLEA